MLVKRARRLVRSACGAPFGTPSRPFRLPVARQTCKQKRRGRPLAVGSNSFPQAAQTFRSGATTLLFVTWSMRDEIYPPARLTARNGSYEPSFNGFAVKGDCVRMLYAVMRTKYARRDSSG
ncbi:hypothetical protein GCM10017688_44650 [Streptomyces ramulosus]